MTAKQFFTLLSLSFLIPTTLFAQNQSLDQVSTALEGFMTAHPQEKVFLHTDRSYYAVGESIWFQTYLTAGPLNLPSPLSFPVYVQLFDEKEKLISQRTVLTPYGFGHGVIDLTDSLVAGEYTLVAFTNWMKNTGKEFYFRKDISILSGEQKETIAMATSDEIDIQFFPEGGDLIQGIPTKVAFKAIDANGRSIEVDGNVTDNSGQTVSTLKTQHAGMGFFYITPEAGKSYSAYVLGIDRSFELPQVQKNGIGMRLIPAGDSELKLTITAKDISTRQKKLHAPVNSRGLVTFSAQVNLSGSIALINIPTENIPPGISHLTLFDEDSNPLLERLFFVGDTTNHLSVSSDKPAYKKREKVNIKIELDAMITDSINGVFSVSAYDIGQTIEKEPESNIITELLLNSDLKGNLENPAYYFNKENPEATKHLDLVMLTHGWRRFSWNEVLDKEDDELAFNFERGLSLKGTTYLAFSNKPQEAEVSLINLAQPIPTITDLQTLKSGEFEFKDLTIFEGEDLLLIGTRKRGRKNKEMTDIKFVVDSSYYEAPPFSNYKVGSKNRLLDLEKRFMEKRKIREKIDAAYNFDPDAIRLDDFVIEADRLDAAGRPLESTTFGRGSDAVDFTKGPPIVDYNIFRTVARTIPNIAVTQNGVSLGGGRGTIPLLLLDDNIATFEFILGFPPNEFYKAVLLRGSAAWARFGGAGRPILAFYTKTRAGIIDERFEKEDGLFSTQLKNGYQQPREFYTPKYDVKKPEDIKPDYRILLHWQPLIYLGDEEETTVEFWTSDLETTILVNVQGLLQDGTPVSKVIYFEIEK